MFPIPFANNLPDAPYLRDLNLSLTVKDMLACLNDGVDTNL